MTDQNSLRDLDARHDEARAAARRRIDVAEERLMHYRSRMNTMQETFHHLAVQRGVAEDSSFRFAFQRVSHEYEENLRDGIRVLRDLEEDYDAMTRRQAQEREDLIRRPAEGGSRTRT
jgi:hypothetical protein